MKDNYSEMNVDMEQLLFSKEYDELSPSELEEIKEFISSKEDFYLMKNTLANVKTSFGIEEEIEPDVNSKEKLMKMFADKNGKVVPLHRPFYLNPVFQIGVAAAIVLGIIFFYPKGSEESVTAMNDEPATENTTSKDEAKEESTTESIDDVTVEAEEVAEPEENPSVEEKSVNPDVAASGLAEKSGNGPAVNTKAAATTLMEADEKKELAKGEKAEGYFKNDPGKENTERELYTVAERSSAGKDKAKEAEKISASGDLAEDDAIVSAFTTGATTTITNTSTGSAVTYSATVPASDSSVSLADGATSKKSYDKDDKPGRTNNTDEFTMPAKAADLKTGVTLKDKPALAEFLFTAL